MKEHVYIVYSIDGDENIYANWSFRGVFRFEDDAKKFAEDYSSQWWGIKMKVEKDELQ